MQQFGDEEKYLVDLWQPETLLKLREVVETSTSLEQECIFQLTGWRGAGWRMVFLDEPER